MYASNDPTQGGGAAAPRAQLLAMAVANAQNRMQNRAPSQAGYMTGTQNQQALTNMMQRRGDPAPMIQATLKDRAGSYAKQRLAQFGQVADLMGGDFASQFHSQDQSGPAAAYRALSGLFTKASQSQGVADPRVMLAQLLMQARGK